MSVDSQIGKAVMEKIFLDTSIFIEFARTGGGKYLEIIKHAVARSSMLVTSSLVVYEFWKGSSLNNPIKLQQAEVLFSEEITIYPVTTSIAKLAGELSRSKQCRNTDAVLAATALEHNARLATLNRKDFSSVKKLKLFD